MADVYVSAQWHVQPGREDEFVRRWSEFLSWTAQAHGDGFERARLLRNESDPHHFVSFAEWETAEARDGWRGDPRFVTYFGACREICADINASTYYEVAALG